LSDDGKQIGIVNREEALKKAIELGVDLVEVAPKAIPPVCRLIEFKKFKYQESKKERLDKKKAKEVETKEIRLGPFTDDHDLDVRINRANNFLKKGDRVRIAIKFAGRQLGKKEFGFQILNKFLEGLKDCSKIEKEAHFEGSTLTATLAPYKNKVETKHE